MRESRWLVVMSLIAGITCAASQTARADCPDCQYYLYRYEVSTDSGVGGWCDAWGPPADIKYAIWLDGYYCNTGQANGQGGFQIATKCPGNPAHEEYMAEHPNGGISYSYYYCDDPGCVDPSCLEDPGLCDGSDLEGADPLEEGCGNQDSDNQCSSIDGDDHPLRFTSGRIESNPIVPFEAPTPEGAFFGIRLRYGSDEVRRLATNAGGTTPAIHGPNEDTHFMGLGWIDNVSERLYFAGTGPTSTVIWRSETSWVGFYTTDSSPGPYIHFKSTGGRFAMLDRGSGQSPRYVITQTTPKTRMWGFNDLVYYDYANQPKTVGTIVKEALTTSVTDYTGYYSIEIARLADGRVSTVTDSIGRQLTYAYLSVTNGAGTITYSHRLQSISYLPYPGASPVEVASFDYFATSQLDRIEFGSTYRRFRYQHPIPQGCINCAALLTEVIQPSAPVTAIPPVGAELDENFEVITEGHEYEVLAGRARGFRTFGLNREWAYMYSGTTETTQLDLHQQGVSCLSASCAADYSCWDTGAGADDMCYASTVYSYDPDLAEVTSMTGVCDGCPSEFIYDPTTGSLKASIDPAGVKTTYAYDNNGDTFCMVRNDDDNDAAVDPNGCRSRIA